MMIYEQWDKQSPVNDIEAIDLIGQEQMENDDIFILVKDDEGNIISVESIATIQAIYGFEGESWEEVAEQYLETIKPEETKEPVLTLEEVRALKISEIQMAYNQCLTNGFSSSAIGEEHIFAYGQTDREKFMQLAISVLSEVAIFPVPIPAKNGTLVFHTFEQYKLLISDISTFAWNCQNLHYVLIEQARHAESVEELNNIVVNFDADT